MKKTLALVASGLLIAASSAQAGPAPVKNPVLPPPPSDAGWYFSLDGGALWMNDADVNTSFGTADLNFDVGWGVNGAVGYHFDSGINLDLSAGYLRAEFDSIGGSRRSINIDGDLNMVPITLNLSYDLKLTERLSFYLGAGAGVAWSELDVNSIGGFDVANGADGWNFAWQARGGFAYDVSSAVSLNVGYRFVEVEDGLGRFGDSQGQMAELGLKVPF